MTNRVLTLVVTLDKEFREDDVDKIVEAISMIKHIARVKKNTYTCEHQMNVSEGISNFKYEFLKELAKKIQEL
jgi:hypothetical protein